MRNEKFIWFCQEITIPSFFFSFFFLSIFFFSFFSSLRRPASHWNAGHQPRHQLDWPRTISIKHDNWSLNLAVEKLFTRVQLSFKILLGWPTSFSLASYVHLSLRQVCRKDLVVNGDHGWCWPEEFEERLGLHLRFSIYTLEKALELSHRNSRDNTSFV